MFSLELNRMISFPRLGGTNLSPAWAPDGTRSGGVTPPREWISEYLCDGQRVRRQP